MTPDKLHAYATKLLGGPPKDVSDWQTVSRELFQEHMNHQPRAVRQLERALEHIELRFADVLEVADRIPDDKEEELPQDVLTRVFGLLRDLKTVTAHLMDSLLGGTRSNVGVDFTDTERIYLLEALDQASVRYEEIIADGCQDNVPGDGSGVEQERTLRESLEAFNGLAEKLAAVTPDAPFDPRD